MLRSSLFRAGEDDSSCASPRSVQPGENPIYTQKRLCGDKDGRLRDRKCTPEIGSGRSGSFGPPGAIRSFESENLKGATAASLLWLCCAVCVFLMLISPSCWKAKHSLCTQMLTAVMRTTSSVTLNHSHRHRDGWHTSFLYDHWRQFFFLLELESTNTMLVSCSAPEGYLYCSRCSVTKTHRICLIQMCLHHGV